MKKNPFNDELTIEMHELGLIDAHFDLQRIFRITQSEQASTHRTHTPEFRKKRCDFSTPDKVQAEPINWDQRIDKLEKYFAVSKFPINSIDLNPWTKIFNIQGFIENHLTEIKSCKQHWIHLPCLERLEKLMKMLQSLPLSFA